MLTLRRTAVLLLGFSLLGVPSAQADVMGCLRELKDQALSLFSSPPDENIHGIYRWKNGNDTLIVDTRGIRSGRLRLKNFGAYRPVPEGGPAPDHRLDLKRKFNSDVPTGSMILATFQMDSQPEPSRLIFYVTPDNRTEVVEHFFSPYGESIQYYERRDGSPEDGVSGSPQEQSHPLATTHTETRDTERAFFSR